MLVVLLSMATCSSGNFHRIALSMIKNAKNEGLITPWKTVLIKATGSNTGIGLAFIATTEGYKLVIVTHQHTKWKKGIVTGSFGTESCLTDRSIDGVCQEGEEIVQNTLNSYFFKQFENPTYPKNYYEATGPEMLNRSEGNSSFLFWDREKHVNIKVCSIGPVKYLKC